MDPSPRVRLEVDLLDADQSAPAPDPPPALDDRPCLTVLVVAAEADLRRYVRECLRRRTDLRFLEAATVAAATTLAAHYWPDVLVVDEPAVGILVQLPELRAIVLVDDVPRNAPAPGPHHWLLARPFTAEGMLAVLDLLLRQ